MEIWRLKYWTQGPGHRKKTEGWKEKEEGGGEEKGKGKWKRKRKGKGMKEKRNGK